jgi:hypothetical protein
MTQLLIVGSTILAQGPFEQTDDEIKSADAIYPKHVIDGYQLVEADLPEGFTCAGYEWIEDALSAKPPVVIPPVVPQSVTRFQALAALDAAGHLDAVEAIMADPATPKLQRLAYQNALNFERSSTTLQVLAGALGLTDADLDQLFITAAGIVA